LRVEGGEFQGFRVSGFRYRVLGIGLRDLMGVMDASHTCKLSTVAITPLAHCWDCKR